MILSDVGEWFVSMVAACLDNLAPADSATPKQGSKKFSNIGQPPSFVRS